jgi:quinol-cytochrome oxidoreductase complex cytochrome b subunit
MIGFVFITIMLSLKQQATIRLVTTNLWFMNSSNSILAVYKNHIQYYPTNYSLNYSWSLGSLSGIFLSLQLVTGFMMASHYLPYEYIVFENLEHIVRDVDFG